MSDKLVLKASAGTGKTYRLSLEYIVALCKGMDYKNILVMTFTKKATAEIKKAVLDKLAEFLEIYHLVNKTEKDILTTIEELNIDEKKKENFKNLIDSIEKILNIRMNREFLRKLFVIHEDILKNKEKIKIYTIDAFLNIIFKNIIINFLQIKTYNLIDEEKNEYYYKKVLENIFNNKLLFEKFKNFFNENSEKNVDSYIKVIKNLIENRWKYLISNYNNENFYSKEELKIEKDSYLVLNDIFNYIQESCAKDLKDSLKKDFQVYAERNLSEIREKMAKDYSVFLGTEQLINGNKFKKKDDVENKEYIKKQYEYFKELFAKELYNDILIPYEKEIMSLSAEIYKIYDELKLRERNFTFNDISTYTYENLFKKENSLFNENSLDNSFFESLDMQIEAIFIDEFQDTSILQWKILFEIIKKASYVICVGDEKQSIYGWRGGEKRLFENLKEILNSEIDTMDISYRSDINIVNYTNKIFNDISAKITNWKFKESNANSKDEGYVKCINIKREKDEKISLSQVLVKELKESNLKNYSDIAIIARTNKELEEIASLLEEEKIPYNLNRKNSMEKFSGLSEYLDFLKFLLYGNELALFNFLASDLSGFGTDELELLLKNKQKTVNYLADIEDKEFESFLSPYMAAFLEKIKYFKKEYKKLNAQDLTYKIFEKFKFSRIFNKEIDLKNLSEAYLMAKKYQNILELLIAYENGEIEFSELNSSSNSVELMTIHKSKGLQFKTVFVLNKKEKNRVRELDFIFTMDKTYSDVLFSLFLKKGYGKVIENSHKEIVSAYRQMEEEEKINNLYVAITRAKNNLIIISEDLENEKIGNLKTFDTKEKQEENKNKNYDLKNQIKTYIKNEEIEINKSKFSLVTEEKRMLGILIHYFLENIKYGTEEEINYAVKLCYKDYLSYFGEEKLQKIFSKKNIDEILKIAGDIFSEKWDHIYSEYELYDYENKKSYRIDRIMICDDDNTKNGEIYIVDYKTGARNEEQLRNYVHILQKNFGEEIQNYKIRTKFLDFNIEY